MQAASRHGFTRPYDWRRRNLMLRGLLSLAGMLLVLSAWALKALPMHPAMALLWIGLLTAPNLLFWLTRTLSPARQTSLLGIELLLDILLFLGLISHFGGAGNPVAFYLLVPLLIASLSLPLAHALLLLLAAFSGYGLSLHFGVGSTGHEHPLHELTHGISNIHGIGMWLMFGLLGGTIIALGHALQQAQARHARQQAVELNLSLQRERMYQIAADLADRAHEINTPLNALLLLTEDWREDGSATQRQVHQLSQRMAGILARQPVTDDARPVRLSHLCTRVQKQLQLLAPEMKVQCEGPDDPLLHPESDWLRILNNLGYNACDAGARQFVIRAGHQDDQQMLHVSDDGPRQETPDEEKRRQGFGLGLVLVESTLASLGGTLELVFDHRWTTAIIRLPYRSAHE